jgi:hypothetical protein
MSRRTHKKATYVQVSRNNPIGDAKYRPRKYQPHHPEPGMKQHVVAGLCILFAVLGIAIGILVAPYTSGVQLTNADVDKPKIEDISIDEIKQFVKQNKFQFPEFFPEAKPLIQSLKPEPVVTPTPTPTPKYEVKQVRKSYMEELKESIKVIKGTGRFRIFQIFYLHDYYDDFRGKVSYPETKYHYIKYLESERTPDGVLFSFSTPKSGMITALMLSNGTVHWDSTACTQLDVERAIQIMIDNV